MAVFLRLFATVILACVTSSGVHAARSSQEPAATGAATGSITGQVTLKGKPAPGVTVVATPSDKDPAQMVRQMFEKQPAFKSSTDQDGNYRITGIPAGRYKVTVYSPTNVQDRSDDGGDGSTVTLSEGEELEDIDFDLEPGGVITGTITDASGRPLVREFVNINPVGDSEKDARQMIKTANMSMFYTDDR
ncbi:MAG TPA: carboxypeptidase regulatory-like domain-containing protein, partial [Blastocatellia bacterium]|nr:carboxypeptidase regulatory-like domain-containing protein [Blastocatellia bacterium]